MLCEQFEKRIDIVLDQRLDLATDPSLQQHALVCSECNEMLDEFQQLQALFRCNSAFKSVTTVDYGNPGAEGRFSSRGVASHRMDLVQADTPFEQNQVEIRKKEHGVSPTDRGPWQLVVVASLLIGLIPLMALMNQSRNSADRYLISMSDAHVGIPNAFGGDRYQQENFQLIGDESNWGPKQNELKRPVEVGSVDWLVTFEKLPEQLTVLEPYYAYTTDLPGMLPLRTSFNFSVDLIRRSINNTNRQGVNPDFGYFEMMPDRLGGLA